MKIRAAMRKMIRTRSRNFFYSALRNVPSPTLLKDQGPVFQHLESSCYDAKHYA